MVRISKYDWSASHGSFKKIVSANDNNIWVNKCNECLLELPTPSISASIDTTTSTQRGEGETTEKRLSEKRVASKTMINNLLAPSKRARTNVEKASEIGTDQASSKLEACRVGMVVHEL